MPLDCRGAHEVNVLQMDSLEYEFSHERDLYDKFASGVAYIVTEDQCGVPAIGTCFHIGDNIFITARHVVDNRKITNIATTNAGIRGSDGKYSAAYMAGTATCIHGPFYHTDPNYDLAALRLEGIFAPQIPFLPIFDDRFENKMILRSIVVMGFPPIPGSSSPVLVCAKAEVNASFITYFDKQRVYIVSCLARGGFSGGPALTPPHHCMGVITRAVLKESVPEELGFMAVVGPVPILELLDHHKIMPGYLREQVWEPHLRRNWRL